MSTEHELKLLSLAANKSGKAAGPRPRPGLATGTVDKVEFGVLLKGWQGIDFTHGSSSMDAVLMLKWKDKRNAAKMPAGVDKMRLPIDTAAKYIWMPEIAFSNAASTGNHAISNSVLIESNGQVTRVERELVTLRESWKVHNFPFDSQTVNMDLASTVYMADEVELVPTSDASMWGVESSDIFKNSPWGYDEQHISTFLDQDGLLKKSRGRLSLMVTRDPHEFSMQVGLPSVVLLFMTWTAFWLPMHGPYVMPRVAINAFGLLCQLAVSNTAASLNPMNGQHSIMTEYLSLCIQLQFTAMMLNILLLALEQSKYGNKFNGGVNDMIVTTFPITTCINIIILATGRFIISDIVCWLTMVCYFVHLYRQYHYYKDGGINVKSEEEEAMEVLEAMKGLAGTASVAGAAKDPEAPASGEPAAAAPAAGEPPK
jgi:hypothetical protein